MAEMKVIGIVGGVASGKSFVARCLENLGAVHLDADRVGHEVLHDQEVKALARLRWGRTIFDEQSEIDRRKLAKIVFGEGISAIRERNYLEQLTHPRIRDRLQWELDSARRAGRLAVVLDAALLLETGWSEFCDSILFVEAADAVRQSRAQARGWSEQEWKSREASQMPLSEKRGMAQATVDNGGTESNTRRQVQAYWDSLFAADLSN